MIIGFGEGGAPVICSINDRVTNTNLCGRENGRFRWLITLNVLKFAYERDSVCLKIPMNHGTIRVISLLYLPVGQWLGYGRTVMSKHGSNWTHLTHFVSKIMFMCAHYFKIICQWGRMISEGWYYPIALGLKTLFLHRYFELRALRTNMIVFERGHFFARNPVVNEYAIWLICQ